MQVTIDIPEPLYREMQNEARDRHISLQELAAFRLSSQTMRQTTSKEQQVVLPLVHSEQPGTVDLNRNLNEMAFDDLHAS